MRCFVYNDFSKFNRFYYENLFTEKLEEVTEEEFDALVLKFRNLYELEYDGPNAQNFLYYGRVIARRERTINSRRERIIDSVNEFESGVE